MSEKEEERVIYVTQKRHGYGILDWLNDSFLIRLLRFLGPLALLVGAYGFLLDLGDRRAERDTEAWQLVMTPASGNSGKTKALEYLNSDTSLRIPYPPSDPERWPVIVSDFGPFKSKTPLVGIDLSGKRSADGKEWVSRVYLVGLQLPQAELERAHFDGAELDHSNLKGAHLLRAHFEGAWLNSVNFENAYMVDVHLEGASLVDANLKQAWLSGAHLQGAWLVGANLEGALVDHAEFEGADLGLANLRGAYGLTQSQIDVACTLNTILPRGMSQSYCLRSDLGDLILDSAGKPIHSQHTLPVHHQ